VKKTAAKKEAPKAATAKKKTENLSAPMTKTQILTEIADTAALTKKQVQSVLDELSSLIERHINPKKGVSQFTLPGLMKVQVINKKATKARKGINPFTGQEQMFKAKPARSVVKIRPLKKLKDMVA
jgi:nucleoid DNA-binding protein